MMEYIRDGRAPVPESETTSRVMSANKGKDTGPEILLRRALRESEEQGLVECLTPDRSKNRVYGVTDKGRRILDMLDEMELSAEGSVE